MFALGAVNYENVSPWWILVIAVVAVVIVVGGLSLVTIPYDRRIMRHAFEAHRRSLEVSLQLEDERARAAQEARQRAEEAGRGGSQPETAAS